MFWELKHFKDFNGTKKKAQTIRKGKEKRQSETFSPQKKTGRNRGPTQQSYYILGNRFAHALPP